MWKYSRIPKIPVEYVERIEQDPICLVGTTWIWEENGATRIIVIRNIQVPGISQDAPKNTYKPVTVGFYPVDPLPTDPVEWGPIHAFYLSYFIEHCVPWTPPTGPTAWEHLLQDDGL